jgi:hypothetical protein
MLAQKAVFFPFNIGLRLLFFFQYAEFNIDQISIPISAHRTLSPDLLGHANVLMEYNFDVIDLLALIILWQLPYPIAFLHHSTVDIFIIV